MKKYLVIDIGGTKTAVALYTEDYNEIFYGTILTNPKDGCEKLARRLYNMVSHLFDSHKIHSGAIACPGPLDLKNGIVNNTTTLKWENINIIKLFSEKFGIDFKLINDCNAGALGENINLKKSNLVYLSISTGIGGGIIIDGNLYQGKGNAAEFGHIRVENNGLKCGCGGKDCLELYASGIAIEQQYYLKTNKMLTGAVIADLAKVGDEDAAEIFNSSAAYILKAIKIINKILDPEVYVIGGGIAEAEVFRKNKIFEKSLKNRGIDIMFSNLHGKQVLMGLVYYIKKFEVENVG